MATMLWLKGSNYRVTREAPGDGWDQGDSDEDFTLAWQECEADRHVAWGNKLTEATGEVWVVWAKYFTGSTFGEVAAGTILGVYTSQEEAREVVAAAEKVQGFTFEVRGKTYSAVWWGYFETLDFVKTKKLHLQG